MKTYFVAGHAAHAPPFEFFRGERVAAFEKPERADHVLAALRHAGHALHAPHTDSAAVLAQIHTPRYLQFLQTAWAQWLALDAAHASATPFPSVWPTRGLRSDVPPTNFVAQLGLYSFDNGTPMSAGTWAVAKASADCAASAAADLQRGLDRHVFCATRPPGHHAGADFMGGYCFLNHAAVAAQALRNGGAPRVAVLDVDYHHGNGTQSIFYERADVLVANLHADPRTDYPFFLGHADETGAGPGLGFNVNLPLPQGTDGATWLAALDLACQRVVQHRPDALVVSLGLDTFEGDPISHFGLTGTDYRRLGARLAKLGLPTVLILEGGYAAAELGHNAVAVLAGLTDA
jgi:acetoin utilization deacetylase AcuC-like enzyme